MKVRAIVEFESSGVRSAQDTLENAGLTILEGPDEVEEDEEFEDDYDGGGEEDEVETTQDETLEEKEVEEEES